MRLGKISAILLGIAAATIVALIALRPGWGNPLAALGGLLVMFSFPVSLIFGIVGIVCDKRKILAIITTIIAGGFALFYLCMMAFSIIIMMCRWACRLPSLILTFNLIELCSIENMDCHSFDKFRRDSEAKPKNLNSWAIKRFFTPLRSVQNDSFCNFSTEQ